MQIQFVDFKLHDDKEKKMHTGTVTYSTRFDPMKMLAQMNPGKGNLASCPFRDATGMCGKPKCWLFHMGRDCETYIRQGKCRDKTCKLQHCEQRRRYFKDQAPRPDQKTV